jgi:uncharacterized protein (TIGR03437 family)
MKKGLRGLFCFPRSSFFYLSRNPLHLHGMKKIALSLLVLITSYSVALAQMNGSIVVQVRSGSDINLTLQNSASNSPSSVSRSQVGSFGTLQLRVLRSTNGPVSNANGDLATAELSGGVNGLAQIAAPKGGLIGVFTGETLRATVRQMKFDYMGDIQDESLNNPDLQQPFYIGDGLIPGTDMARFILVPAGATRLFLAAKGLETAAPTTYDVQISFSPSGMLSPSQPQASPVEVRGFKNPFFAGYSDGSLAFNRDLEPPNQSEAPSFNTPDAAIYPGTVGQFIPTGARARFVTNGQISIPTTTGQTEVGPNGDSSQIVMNTGFGRNGGIRAPRGSLIGIFEGLDQPRPEMVDYSSLSSRDQALLQPKLGEPFFIGDGKTSDGRWREVIAPERTVRLKLGSLAPSPAPLLEASAFPASNVSHTGSFLVSVITPSDETSISDAGVVSAATLSADDSVAPGELFSVFGRNLSEATFINRNTFNLPVFIDNFIAKLDNSVAAVSFASPNQTNLLASTWVKPGSEVLLTIQNRSRVTAKKIRVVATRPGLFERDGRAIIINNRTSTSVSSSSPARAGDVITLYGTGFGLTDPVLRSYGRTPTDQLYRFVAPVRILINGQELVPDFAGLSPDSIALGQINFRIPEGVRGNVDFQVKAGTATTKSHTLFVE